MIEHIFGDDFKNIVNTLVRFSLPLILSGILQQLYNWVDAFIVGTVEGELALEMCIRDRVRSQQQAATYRRDCKGVVVL